MLGFVGMLLLFLHIWYSMYYRLLLGFYVRVLCMCQYCSSSSLGSWCLLIYYNFSQAFMIFLCICAELLLSRSSCFSNCIRRLFRPSVILGMSSHSSSLLHFRVSFPHSGLLFCLCYLDMCIAGLLYFLLYMAPLFAYCSVFPNVSFPMCPCAQFSSFLRSYF